MKKYVFICGAVIAAMLAFVGCLQPATTQVDISTELNAELASNYVSSVPKTDEDNQNLVSLGSGMTVGGIIEEHEAQALREEQAAKDALVNACISSANEVFATYLETVSEADLETVRNIALDAESSAREVVVALVEDGGSRDEGCTAFLEVILNALVAEGFVVDESFYSAQGSSETEEEVEEAEAEVEEEAEAEAEVEEEVAETEEVEDTPTTTESTSSDTSSTGTSSGTSSTGTSSGTSSTGTSSGTSSTGTSSGTSSAVDTVTPPTVTGSVGTSTGTTSNSTSDSVYSSANPWQYTTAEIQAFPTYNIKGELITNGTESYYNNSQDVSNATSSGSTGTTGDSGSGSGSDGWNYSTAEIQDFPTYSITGELITIGNENATSSATSSTSSTSTSWWSGQTIPSTSSATSSTSSTSTSWWSGQTIPSTSSATSSTSSTSTSWWSGQTIPSTSSATSSTSSTSTSWWSGQTIPSTSSSDTSGNVIYNSNGSGDSTYQSNNIPIYNLNGTLMNGTNTNTGTSGTVDGFTTFIFPEGDTGYNSGYNTGASNGTTYYIDYTGNGFNSNYTGETNGSVYVDYTGSGTGGFSGYNGSNTTYINYTGTGYTSDYTGTGTGTSYAYYEGPTNVLPGTSYTGSSDSYIVIQPNTTDYTFSGTGSSAYTSSQYTLIPYSGTTENALSSLYLNYNDGAATGVTTSNGLIYIYPQY